MEKRYKIVLTGNRVYKEIELTPEKAQVKVGTGLDCDIRLRKELFFAPGRAAVYPGKWRLDGLL